MKPRAELYGLYSRLKDRDMFNWLLCEGGPHVCSFAVCLAWLLLRWELELKAA